MEKFANSENSIWSTKSDPTISSSNDWTDDAEVLRSLRAITDSINKKWQIASSAAYLSIFTAGEMVRNARYSMWAMGSSSSLSRDWNKLEDAQQKTLNMATTLWNAGVFIRLWFKEGLEEEIQKILDKYSKWEEALFVINKGNTVTSQPIIIFTDLWSMTNNIKFGLFDSTYFWVHSGIWKNSKANEQYMWKTITLSTWFIENYLNYYKCAKGIKWTTLCSTVGKISTQKWDSRFKNIANDGKEEVWYALWIFKTARKRLSGFWSDNAEADEALQNREYELLRWQYGRRAANPSIIKQIKEISEGWNTSWQTIKENYTKSVSMIEWFLHKWPEKTKKAVIGDQQIEAINDIEKEMLEKVWVDTAREASQSWYESEYANPAPVTKIFPILTQNIIAQRLIIDGKGDKTTINENLWSACLNQCTNVSWKKCSYNE